MHSFYLYSVKGFQTHLSIFKNSSYRSYRELSSIIYDNLLFRLSFIFPDRIHKNDGNYTNKFSVMIYISKTGSNSRNIWNERLNFNNSKLELKNVQIMGF